MKGSADKSVRTAGPVWMNIHQVRRQGTLSMIATCEPNQRANIPAPGANEVPDCHEESKADPTADYDLWAREWHNVNCVPSVTHARSVLDNAEGGSPVAPGILGDGHNAITDSYFEIIEGPQSPRQRRGLTDGLSVQPLSKVQRCRTLTAQRRPRMRVMAESNLR
jgi:hypothetical protein